MRRKAVGLVLAGFILLAGHALATPKARKPSAPKAPTTKASAPKPSATKATAAKPAAPVGTGPVAWLVMDADTGAVLVERDAHKRWPPASMTKMMTVLVAMERVREGTLSLDDPVPVSPWARERPVARRAARGAPACRR